MIELNGIMQVFLGGMVGPFLLELAKIASWRDGSVVQEKYRQTSYWIGTLALFFLAGIVAVLNGVDKIPIVRAAILGIGAPATVAAWASGRVAHLSKRVKSGFAPTETHEETGSSSGNMNKWADLMSW
jgi:hypothetical protein